MKQNKGSHPGLTCLDLFCGCGGFSLGMKRAGFQIVAAVDFDPAAITVFHQNFPVVAQILERDLTHFPPEEFSSLTGIQHVDVIVGGPPCQGFSTIRTENFRPTDDPRRYLYREFLAYVAHFRPRIFVMENVPGIKIIDGGKIHAQILVEIRQLGYKVFPEDVCTWLYGVPQKRVRYFIFGSLPELPDFSMEQFMPPTHEIVTLWEAIGDLPSLAAGEIKNRYDLARRKHHLAKYGGRYLNRVIEVHKAKELTAHYARPRTKRDLREMTKLLEGETVLDALRRGVQFEWPCPKDPKKVFSNKFVRQHRNGLCSTILASMDRGWRTYIHPTQNRPLTPREAARVQTFPDWFEFSVPFTHQCRLIGNAVPPLMAEAVGRAIKMMIRTS